MFVELGREKPFFGFEFGKPLRSISLEILNWWVLDLGKDGWIESHNSYLHIIYRAGAIGIIFVLTCFILFFQMLKISIQLRSIIGILLCGAILSSLVMAFFQPMFELPYSAIPFWSLCGMACNYCFNLKKEIKTAG